MDRVRTMIHMALIESLSEENNCFTKRFFSLAYGVSAVGMAALALVEHAFVHLFQALRHLMFGRLWELWDVFKDLLLNIINDLVVTIVLARLLGLSVLDPVRAYSYLDYSYNQRLTRDFHYSDIDPSGNVPFKYRSNVSRNLEVAQRVGDEEVFQQADVLGEETGLTGRFPGMGWGANLRTTFAIQSGENFLALEPPESSQIANIETGGHLLSPTVSCKEGYLDSYVEREGEQIRSFFGLSINRFQKVACKDKDFEPSIWNTNNAWFRGEYYKIRITSAQRQSIEQQIRSLGKGWKAVWVPEKTQFKREGFDRVLGKGRSNTILD